MVPLKPQADLVVGLGEIGYPIFKLLSRSCTILGYDIDKSKMNLKKFKNIKNSTIVLLHICIPFNKGFVKNVINVCKKYGPRGVVIHSTIPPLTTEDIQKQLNIPVIYSATRGVHKRMFRDLKRYTKFYSVHDYAPNAVWARKTYAQKMKRAGIRTKKMSNPLVLELAKIVVDTSYYGWLINYAQLSNMIAIKNKVDYDEMWTFADEIHKYLDNRPKMFPGFIGGHCIIPNLDLIKDDTLDLIKEINLDYGKILKKRQAKGKKY